LKKPFSRWGAAKHRKHQRPSILKPLRDNGKSNRVAEGLFDLNGSERMGTEKDGEKGKK
jgi:hypothetical protein